MTTDIKPIVVGIGNTPTKPFLLHGDAQADGILKHANAAKADTFNMNEVHSQLRKQFGPKQTPNWRIHSATENDDFGRNKIGNSILVQVERNRILDKGQIVLDDWIKDLHLPVVLLQRESDGFIWADIDPHLPTKKAISAAGAQAMLKEIAEAIDRLDVPTTAGGDWNRRWALVASALKPAGVKPLGGVSIDHVCGKGFKPGKTKVVTSVHNVLTDHHEFLYVECFPTETGDQKKLPAYFKK